jgi:hypothetical protein
VGWIDGRQELKGINYQKQAAVHVVSSSIRNLIPLIVLLLSSCMLPPPSKAKSKCFNINLHF